MIPAARFPTVSVFYEVVPTWIAHTGKLCKALDGETKAFAPASPVLDAHESLAAGGRYLRRSHGACFHRPNGFVESARTVYDPAS